MLSKEFRDEMERRARNENIWIGVYAALTLSVLVAVLVLLIVK